MINLCIFGFNKGLEVYYFPFDFSDLFPNLNSDFIQISSEVNLEELEPTIFVDRRVIRDTKGKDHVVTWVGFYRAVLDQFGRTGGFYGVGAWLCDVVVNSSQLLDILESIADNLKKEAIVGNKFSQSVKEVFASLVLDKAALANLGSTSVLLQPYQGLSEESLSTCVLKNELNKKDVLNWALHERGAQSFRGVYILVGGANNQFQGTRSHACFENLIGAYNFVHEKLRKDYEAKLAHLKHEQLTSKSKEDEMQSMISSLRTRIANTQRTYLPYRIVEQDGFLSSKKNIVIVAIALIVIFSALVYFYYSSPSPQAKAITITPNLIERLSE